VERLDGRGLKEAENAARLAVQLDERYPYALWALAGACLWSRRHDEAVSAAEKLVAFNPSFAEGYGMLGFILHYVGRSEEAVACIDRAMALDPFCSDMMLHFQGQALYQVGRHTDAVGVLKRRILRNPDTDASRVLLAAAYGQMGMIEEARASWREALRVNPATRSSSAARCCPTRIQKISTASSRACARRPYPNSEGRRPGETRPVMLPISGAGKVAHLEENVGTAAIMLTDEEFETLGRVGRAKA
jgi:tetratricopeptide (TPR) repeat protein